MCNKHTTISIQNNGEPNKDASTSISWPKILLSSIVDSAPFFVFHLENLSLACVLNSK